MNTHGLFLSIVIPVYNGENCISRCLNSIWGQGLDERSYEVLCVDDCSTDRTADVVRGIQASHPNLRLLANQENLRAGGSRNHGVREAKGEYILFIDADDYCHPGGLKAAIDYLRKNDFLEILMIGFSRETENLPSFQLVHRCANREVLTGFEFLKENMIPFGPCQYLFKRMLMVGNGIYFQERVQCEDVDWSHQLAFSAQRMQFQPFLVLHMVLNDRSQTATEHLNFKAVSAKLFAGYRMGKMVALYNCRHSVSKHLQAVTNTYIKEGLKYMTGVYAPIPDKSKAIAQYVPAGLPYPFLVRVAVSCPKLFAFLSNLTVPFVKLAIVVKRKYWGR